MTKGKPKRIKRERLPEHEKALPAKAQVARKGVAGKHKKAKKPFKQKETRGVLAKYASHVTSASEGALTDKNL